MTEEVEYDSSGRVSKVIAKRPLEMIGRIAKRPPAEMPAPDEFVLKLIEQTMTRRKLDTLIGEVRAQREISQLTSYIQLPPTSTRMFPSPYKHATVEAGKSKVLYDLDIPGEYLGGVITHLGNSWVENTWFTLDVDHSPVIEQKIKRQIAPVNEPTEQHRFIARKNIRCTAHNDDTEDHDLELLINGFFIPRMALKR